MQASSRRALASPGTARHPPRPHLHLPPQTKTVVAARRSAQVISCASAALPPSATHRVEGVAAALGWALDGGAGGVISGPPKLEGALQNKTCTVVCGSECVRGSGGLASGYPSTRWRQYRKLSSPVRRVRVAHGLHFVRAPLTAERSGTGGRAARQELCSLRQEAGGARPAGISGASGHQRQPARPANTSRCAAQRGACCSSHPAARTVWVPVVRMVNHTRLGSNGSTLQQKASRTVYGGTAAVVLGMGCKPTRSAAHRPNHSCCCRYPASCWNCRR